MPQPQKMRESEAQPRGISDFSLLKLQDKFSAVFTPRRVEELSEPGTRNVVLYVSRIKVIEEIEDPYAYSGVQPIFAKRQRNRTRHLEVK